MMVLIHDCSWFVFTDHAGFLGGVVYIIPGSQRSPAFSAVHHDFVFKAIYFPIVWLVSGPVGVSPPFASVDPSPPIYVYQECTSDPGVKTILVVEEGCDIIVLCIASDRSKGSFSIRDVATEVVSSLPGFGCLNVLVAVTAPVLKPMFTIFKRILDLKFS